ncbi:MAG: NUDIX domain-containing protein [Thermoanaerobaculia bacterium]|jgi:isopentenyldiphosphate isomerase
MTEEMIDLLLPDGTPLGRAKAKSLVHRDGDLHRTAHLWIVTPDKRVLLQLRASTKVNHPSLWDVSVAGHVDAGETAVEAAIREAREELGIALRADELRHIATLRERVVIEEGIYVDNEIEEVYLVRRDVDRAALVLQASEVDDVALVPLDQFRERVAERDATMVEHWEEYEMVAAQVERDDAPR